MRIIVASWLATALLTVGTAAAADSTKAEAKQHFDAGRALMKVEDFEAAAAEFEESVKLYPTKNAMFNLANCLKAVGRYQEAIDAYYQLRVQFADQLDESMIDKMESDIEDIKALVVRLSLTVDKRGATIRIDDREVGTSPLTEPLVLGAGTHQVVVSLDGYQTFELEVSLLAGDHRREAIELEPLPEPTPPPAAAPVETEPVVIVQQAPPLEEGRSGLFVGGVVLLSAGAAMLVTGGITGGLALSKGSNLENQCPDNNCPPEQHEEMDLMFDLAIVTNVMLSVGGIAVVTGTIMLIVDHKRSGGEEEVVEVSLAPRLGSQTAGLALEGRF